MLKNQNISQGILLFKSKRSAMVACMPPSYNVPLSSLCFLGGKTLIRIHSVIMTPEQFVYILNNFIGCFLTFIFVLIFFERQCRWVTCRCVRLLALQNTQGEYCCPYAYHRHSCHRAGYAWFFGSWVGCNTVKCASVKRQEFNRTLTWTLSGNR